MGIVLHPAFQQFHRLRGIALADVRLQQTAGRAAVHRIGRLNLVVQVNRFVVLLRPQVERGDFLLLFGRQVLAPLEPG